MTILKDISDTLKDAKNIVKELDVNVKKPTSLARLSSEATLQFPVITSRAINVDTAQSVVKALERQYAIFVQIVISLDPYLDFERDKRGMPDYLRRIHQNNIDINDFKDLKENAMEFYTNIDGSSMFFSINEGSSPKVISSNKDQCFCVDDYLNDNILNKMYSPSKISLQEALASMDYFLKKNNIEILTEAKEKEKKGNGYKKPKNNNKNNNNSNNNNNNEKSLSERKFEHQQKNDDREFKEKKFNNMFNRTKKNEQARLAERKFNEEKKNNEFNHELNQRKQNYNELKDERDYKHQLEREKTLDDRAEREYQHKIQQDAIQNQLEKDKFEKDLTKLRSDVNSRVSVQLSDNDVKKCNELVPTTLSVVMTEKQGEHFGNTHTFIIGVKGLMHPVNSDEIISNLLSGFKTGNKFFNFLRWTTGEISFVKDLVLNINGIKEDALRKYKGGSHWWTTLKRRKTVAKLKNIRGKNQLLPNASIVCTMEEISELKEAYGLDLMEVKNIKKLMNTYFLLGFAIVDDAQELCYFIFDGESNYQAISYSGLEKENNGKNDFKEIYKLINSGRL